MSRAVEQARRAADALATSLDAKPRDGQQVAKALSAVREKLASLSGLWEGAAEVKGVEVTREASATLTHLEGSTAEALAHPESDIYAESTASLMREFILKANRFFPEK